jgi:hypothetical protein
VRFLWRHLLVVGVCLLLLITPATTASRVAETTGAVAPPDTAADTSALAWSALPEALKGVQAAFLSNDATRLSRLFSRRGPVIVSVPPIADGCLAPGPLRAFLDRLVRDRVSLAFELPSHLPPSGVVDGASDTPAAAFIRVRWTHRPAASATLQVEYLHLALRYAAEDAEWQIVEMRTAMR